jgi:hypothetical protein
MLGLAMPLLGLVTAASPAVGVVLLLVVCFALFSFRWPLYGFFSVVIVSFFHNTNVVYDSPLRIVTERYTLGVVPVVILVLVVLIKVAAESGGQSAHRAAGGAVPCRGKACDYMILLLMVWSTVTVIWSSDPYHGANALFNLAIGCCLYFLAIHLLDETGKIELFFKVLFGSGIFLVMIFMLSNKVEPLNYVREFSGGFSFACDLITYGQRPGGFAPPQIAANIIIFVFFAGCALARKATPAGRVWVVLLSFFFCSAIIASGSKGAAGSFLVALPALFIFARPLRDRAIWLIPLVLAAFVLVVVFNTLFLGSDRLVSGASMNTLSLTYRLEFWSEGFALLRQQILGAGIGGFARIVDPWPGAHSFYFGILFDIGLVGILVFFIFLAALALQLHHLVQQEIDDDLRFYICCLLAFWVAFFIHALVDFSFYLPNIWLFFGVSVALLKVTENSLKGSANGSPARWPGIRPDLCQSFRGVMPTPGRRRRFAAGVPLPVDKNV